MSSDLPKKLRTSLVSALCGEESPEQRIARALAILGVDTLARTFPSQASVAGKEHVLEMPEAQPSAPPRPSKSLRKTHSECLIGDGAAMRLLRETILHVSQTQATVLIRGESGTGKELVARAIHEASPRSARPFICVHCAAVPDSLIETTLFGHERGAFTGAEEKRKGRMEQAAGGTLFLDEVGDIPLGIQVKLLRVLQEREFERVGGSETLPLDVRVVAATHRDLEMMVAEGLFREDLYYRLNVIPISIPPLRERLEDIPGLVQYFWENFCTKHHRQITLGEDMIRLFTSYHWPGNVRELQNCIERLVVLADSAQITLSTVPKTLRPYFDQMQSVVGSSQPALRDSEMQGTLPARLDAMERERLFEALREMKWVKAKAARKLGITPRQIAYKMHKYHITRNSAAS